MKPTRAPAQPDYLPDSALGGGEDYLFCVAIAGGFIEGEAIAAGIGAGSGWPRRVSNRTRT
ncbi:MAG: hypothetical protein ABSD43_14645 [Terracidiphilus sp.]|jgi:hypothetical protein